MTRNVFFEKVNAAFTLKTSYTDFGKIDEDQLAWLSFAYPNSIITKGIDQVASYFSITPKI